MLEDYRSQPDRTAALAQARLASGVPSAVETFPYPNPPSDRVRTFSVLEPLDELVLRTAAGRVAPAVELALTRGGSACRLFSYRLKKKPPAWSYQKPARSEKSRRAAGRALVEDPRFRGMCITDITQYYASIDGRRLGGMLLGFGADPAGVRVVEESLLRVQRHGVAGLPIGPESSGLLGNAYLIPLDAALAALGASVIRATDDYWIFLHDETAPEDLLGPFDSGAERLGLQRNEGKTRFITSPGEALDVMSDLASTMSPEPNELLDRRALMDMAIEALEKESADVRRFRFAIGGLRRVGDREAVKLLLAHPDALGLDPRRVGDYLRHSEMAAAGSASEFFSILEETVTDESDAVHLHILRAAAVRDWGQHEGELFAGIAFDPRRRLSVRAWAAEALGRTPAWNSESSLGLALTPGRATLQRAATLSFRFNLRRKSDRLAIDEVEHQVPELNVTADWVRKIAA